MAVAKWARTMSLLGALAVLAAACGAAGSSGAGRSATRSASGATTTVAAPTTAAAPAHPTRTSVAVSSSPQYGRYLTTSSGFALYTYTADKPGGMGCTEQCLQIWPPLLLARGQTTPMAAHGISGLGTFHRGGRLQVTYHGLPLYTYDEDESAGQVTGQDVVDSGGTWLLATVGAAPKSGAPSSPTTKAPSSGGAAF